MKTIPSAIVTGFAGSARMFYLVKIEASTQTFYWTTASGFTLKETSGGVSLTYDSSMIAKEIDGSEVDGIGTIESGVDLSSGGGMAYVSDFTVTVLNHARFDSTVVAGNIRFEQQPVTVYLGFVSSTVVIADDMLRMWTGVVDDVMDYDHTQFVIKCVDGSFKDHKDIPTRLVNKTEFPNAPDDSVGMPLPELFGNFCPYANNTEYRNALKIEALESPVPTVYTDTFLRVVAAAGHPCVEGFSKAAVYGGARNIWGYLRRPAVPGDKEGDIAEGFAYYGAQDAFAIYLPPDYALLTAYYWQGKLRGDRTTYTGDINPAIDGSFTTSLTLTTGEGLFIRTDFVPKGEIYEEDAKWGYIGGRYYIAGYDFGAITGNGRIESYRDDGLFHLSLSYNSSNANNAVGGVYPLKDLHELKEWQTGVSHLSGSVEIKNAYFNVTVFTELEAK